MTASLPSGENTRYTPKSDPSHANNNAKNNKVGSSDKKSKLKAVGNRKELEVKAEDIALIRLAKGKVGDVVNVKTSKGMSRFQKVGENAVQELPALPTQKTTKLGTETLKTSEINHAPSFPPLGRAPSFPPPATANDIKPNQKTNRANQAAARGRSPLIRGGENQEKQLDPNTLWNIGRGGVSEVFSLKALHKDKLKVIKRPIFANKDYQEVFERGVQIIKKLNPDGRFPLFPAIRDYDLSAIPKGGVIMPYYAGGNLNAYRAKNEKISLLIFSDIVLGMACLAKLHIVHADLKLDNIFVDTKRGQVRLKIGDLDGLAFLDGLKLEDVLDNYKKTQIPLPKFMQVTFHFVCEQNWLTLKSLVDKMQKEAVLLETYKNAGSPDGQQVQAQEKMLNDLFTDYKQKLASLDALALGLVLINSITNRRLPSQTEKRMIQADKLGEDFAVPIPEPLKQALKGLLNPDMDQRTSITEFFESWCGFLQGPGSPLSPEEKVQLGERIKVLENYLKENKPQET